MKKTFSVFLIMILTFAFTCSAAYAEDISAENLPDDDILYRLDMDNISYDIGFEDGIPTEDYTDDTEELGISADISHLSSGNSKVNIIEGSDALSGEKSLVIYNFVDMRVWSMMVDEGKGDCLFFEFKIRFLDDSQISSTFGFGIADPGNESTGSASGGKVITFSTDKNGSITLKTRKGDSIATLEKEKTYTIAVAFPVGESTFDVFIDCVRISKDNRWAGQLSDVSQMFFSSSRAHILLDDIRVTYGDELTKAEYLTPSTPEPTAAPTPEPTAVPEKTAEPEPTSAPSDESSKGCGSVIFTGSAALFAVIAAAAFVMKKK